MPTYLIAEPVMLIAQDLAACIKDVDPDAEMVIVPPGRYVLAAAPDRLHAAFLHMDPEVDQWKPLYVALRARGAELVFFGGAAERSTHSERVLESPFSSETVATVVSLISRNTVVG